TPASLPHHVEERGAPLVIRQQPVQVPADRPAATAADLRASLDHQRQRAAHRLAPPVMNLVAGQGPPRDGPETVKRALPHVLRRLEDRSHGQQPEPSPSLRATLRARLVEELVPEHLIPTAQPEHPRAVANGVTDDLSD